MFQESYPATSPMWYSESEDKYVTQVLEDFSEKEFNSKLMVITYA